MGQIMGLNIEIGVDSEDEEVSNMDQEGNNDSKNGFVAGADIRARLSS